MTRRFTGIAAVMALCFSAASTARAEPQLQIKLGLADGLLLGNPTAVIGLEDPANPGVLVGPQFFNSFVLDTAANGILFAQRAYFDEFFNLDPNLYDIAQNNGSPVQYLESGTGGSALLDVFIEYNVYIAGSAGGSFEFQAGTFRPFGSPDVDLFDIAGLAGMPVMINHDLRVNLRDLINPDANFAMSTTFDSVPASVPTTYTIGLQRLAATHIGQLDPTDPLPTFADIPYISGIKFAHEGKAAAFDTIVDTGASVTFLSTDAALSLGIDPDTDAIGVIEIGGLGGTIFAPVIHVNRMAIPTDEGVDLVFNDLDVIVIDIPGIDAVLGLDALTGAYNEPQINAFFAWLNGEPIPDDYGYFSDMIFDFVGPDWSMRLDVNPVFHNVALLGDLNGDGTIDAYEVNAVKDNFGSIDPGADVNGDGIVDINDLVYVKNHMGDTIPPGLNVPESGAAALWLMFGIPMLMRRGHGR